MRRWLHGLRWRTCSTCSAEFRRHKPAFPSLVGFSYCSQRCEAEQWARWIKGPQ